MRFPKTTYHCKQRSFVFRNNNRKSKQIPILSCSSCERGMPIISTRNTCYPSLSIYNGAIILFWYSFPSMAASKKRHSAGVNKQKHIACLAGESKECHRRFIGRNKPGPVKDARENRHLGKPETHVRNLRIFGDGNRTAYTRRTDQAGNDII